eukprot:2682387-Rhodomonas_salina.1
MLSGCGVCLVLHGPPHTRHHAPPCSCAIPTFLLPTPRSSILHPHPAHLILPPNFLDAEPRAINPDRRCAEQTLGRQELCQGSGEPAICYAYHPNTDPATC